MSAPSWRSEATVKPSLTALLIVLGASAAAQTWTPVTGVGDGVGSGPRDSWIRDAGVFTTYAFSTAYLVGTGGVETSEVLPGTTNSWKGTYLSGPQCVGGVVATPPAEYADCTNFSTTPTTVAPP